MSLSSGADVVFTTLAGACVGAMLVICVISGPAVPQFNEHLGDGSCVTVYANEKGQEFCSFKYKGKLYKLAFNVN